MWGTQPQNLVSRSACHGTHSLSCLLRTNLLQVSFAHAWEVELKALTLWGPEHPLVGKWCKDTKVARVRPWNPVLQKEEFGPSQPCFVELPLSWAVDSATESAKIAHYLVEGEHCGLGVLMLRTARQQTTLQF